MCHLFDRIDNRLQAFRGWDYFLIIHRVSDGKIIKSMIQEGADNKAHIEALLA